MSKILMAALLFASSAIAQPRTSNAAPAVDKAKLEAYVRHLLLWGPHITVTVADPVAGPMPGFNEVKVTGGYKTISLDEIFYVSQNGQKIVRGTVYDIDKNPFSGEIEKLKTDLSPSLGTPGAKVVVVVFSDFQCGYCREEAKMLRENLLKTYPQDVRLYFKDFPIEQIHPWAKPAAIAGRCVFRENPAAFWDYHDWIFDKQAEMTLENLKTKIGGWVTSKGLDAVQFSRCYDNKSTEKDLIASAEQARLLRVTSTPSMFVNGRPLPGAVPWEQLKAIVDWELDYSKRTGIAGEKCCELTLPVPVPGAAPARK
jgi:protein-disulfide isomerase